MADFRKQSWSAEVKTFAAGFTLLEVMVAITLIAIIMTAVYRLHGQTIAMNNAARFYTTAPLLAQMKFAEVGVTIESDSLDGSGDFGDRFPGYAWTMAAEDVESEVLSEEVYEKLKRIDVAVSFNEDEYVYHFRTYRYVEDEP